MQLSVWTYPWDVQDQGIEETDAGLRGRTGLNVFRRGIFRAG